MIRKNAREVLGIFVLALIIALLLVVITILLTQRNLSSNWYTNLGAISTAVGVVVSSILLIVTILYLLATREMVTEARRQRELQEEPAVSVRIVPDKDNFDILVVTLKNTGGAPAYDVSVQFTPDLPYDDGGINDLDIFKRMPYLDKNEVVEFFFASTYEYFKSDSPKRATANITYYKTPLVEHNKNNQPIRRTVALNIEERKGHLYIPRNGVHDLVKEVEELKQGVLILLAQRNQQSKQDPGSYGDDDD
ncbi:hypothetical protein PAECIP111892_04637 [Paenibacillus auburnensis]|uniref:Uncharacterized protein n=1 Tax=Paenibacillus auburnensis TaxID=2905649 RepID=A0ABN8GUW7_9BACL|nr:hypothetical protein [Paenibacillus auburnensis]CAH1218966.1 hypothetical protein PAECIP111892_04637 [Paenibacillus auburnensis]